MIDAIVVMPSASPATQISSRPTRPGGLAGDVERLRDRHEEPRAGVLELERDLLGVVDRVDRGHRAAGEDRAVERDAYSIVFGMNTASVSPLPNPRAARPPANRRTWSYSSP
jgi:hypothetical protein